MQSIRILAVLLAVAIGGASIPAAAQVTANGGFDAPMSAITDQNFVSELIQENNRQIERADAQLHSGNADVRAFAHTTFVESLAANAQVEATARSLGFKVPDAILSAYSVRAAPPAIPDRAFMAQQVTAQQDIVIALRHETKYASTPQIKTLAMHLLPVAQTHLIMAQQYIAVGKITPIPMPTPPQN